MSDHRSRALERAAAQADPEVDPTPHVALKRQLIREGASGPWGLGPDPCDCDGYPGCEGGHGTHRVTYPAAPLRDLVRLRAYAGCGVSQAALGCDCSGLPSGRCEIGGSRIRTCPKRLAKAPSYWATGLLRLAAALPGVEVDLGVCGSILCAKGYGLRGCRQCNGTGQRTHTTPAERWLSVVVAVACGRAVLAAMQHRVDRDLEHHAQCACHAAIRALDAAAAWTRCPCPERAEAASQYTRDRPVWVDAASLILNPPLAMDTYWAANLGRILASAAQHLTPDAVRAAACAAVLGVVPL